MKYTVGLVALVAAVAVAVLAPEWYCRWQDGRKLGEVTLTSRESIQFLDTDSLDIAGRLKTLQEAGENAECDWEQTGYFMGTDTFETTANRCNSIINKWIDAGVLPEVCRDWLWDETRDGELLSQYQFLAPYVIYLNQLVLPVYILRFPADDYWKDASNVTDEGYEEAFNMTDDGYGEYTSDAGRGHIMTVVMDAELDVIYYISAAGEDILDYMFRGIGYDSAEEADESVAAGKPLSQSGDSNVSDADFAGIYGANSAEVEGYQDHWLELDITLFFDNFQGQMFRRLISADSMEGYALMYASETWTDIVEGILGEFGVAEYRIENIYEESDSNQENAAAGGYEDVTVIE